MSRWLTKRGGFFAILLFSFTSHISYAQSSTIAAENVGWFVSDPKYGIYSSPQAGCDSQNPPYIAQLYGPIFAKIYQNGPSYGCYRPGPENMAYPGYPGFTYYFSVTPLYKCLAGERIGNICVQVSYDTRLENAGKISCGLSRGNPINIGTGNKYQEETDYVGRGAYPLWYRRQYNGQFDATRLTQPILYPNINPPLYAPQAFKLWSGSYDRMLKSFASDSPSISSTYLYRPDGKIIVFTLTNGVWVADAKVTDKLVRLVDASGNLTGWRYTLAEDNSIETYDVSGKLVTIANAAGLAHSLTYSDASTPAVVASVPGLLIRVTDAFGGQLNFAYDGTNRLVMMLDPAGGTTTYAYDEASSIVVSGQPGNNLTSITYSDGKKRVYWYNEQDKTANTNLPNALTGITDENNTRFAIWNYDVHGYAISSEHAGGVEKYSVDYTQGNGQSTVTDPLGSVRTSNFQTILGVVKSTGQSQPGGAGCSAAASNLTYDANGNVATSTDFNGTITTYSYDLTRNLETSRVEASGTAQSRTVTTAWHATYRLPLQIAEPKMLTTYAYDTSGNLLSKTVQATSDATGAQGLSPTLVGTARTWSYTYNTVGQVLTVTGPRTDVADKTTYTYDTSGNLSTITNAVGQVTTLSNYDANGRAGLITDANGATTALTYSPRGWLTGKTATSGGTVETTTYGYDGVGQLTLVTLPDTSTVSYTYDPAHRLTNIADSLGNRIAYTLDNMGNRTNEQVKDPSGALARQTSRVVDALNRIQQITGAVQ